GTLDWRSAGTSTLDSDAIASNLLASGTFDPAVASAGPAGELAVAPPVATAADPRTKCSGASTSGASEEGTVAIGTASGSAAGGAPTIACTSDGSWGWES